MRRGPLCLCSWELSCGEAALSPSKSERLQLPFGRFAERKPTHEITTLLRRRLLLCAPPHTHPGSQAHLRGFFCFQVQKHHYVAFVYNRGRQEWLLLDDDQAVPVRISSELKDS